MIRSRSIAGRVLRGYRHAIAETMATGQATEHSYRPALQALVEGLGSDAVRAVNEPSHVACGAPDFVVTRGDVPIGHIECKDIGANLERVESDEQLKRYRAGLPNLILTDYLEFRRYAHGELRETTRVGRIDGQGDLRRYRGCKKHRRVIRCVPRGRSSDDCRSAQARRTNGGQGPAVAGRYWADSEE